MNPSISPSYWPRADCSPSTNYGLHNALVNNMIEGWMLARRAVLRIIDFVAGRIDGDEHTQQI
jgi:hypothetical protein